MKIFDHQPKISTADRKRLLPLMTGWTKLSSVIKTLSEDDLKRCVILEADGHKRKHILERLLGRYNKTAKQRILNAIETKTA